MSTTIYTFFNFCATLASCYLCTWTERWQCEGSGRNSPCQLSLWAATRTHTHPKSTYTNTAEAHGHHDNSSLRNFSNPMVMVLTSLANSDGCTVPWSNSLSSWTYIFVFRPSIFNTALLYIWLINWAALSLVSLLLLLFGGKENQTAPICSIITTTKRRRKKTHGGYRNGWGLDIDAISCAGPIKIEQDKGLQDLCTMDSIDYSRIVIVRPRPIHQYRLNRSLQ